MDMQTLAPQRLQSTKKWQDERWEGEEKCVDQANTTAAEENQDPGTRIHLQLYLGFRIYFVYENKDYPLTRVCFQYLFNTSFSLLLAMCLNFMDL